MLFSIHSILMASFMLALYQVGSIDAKSSLQTGNDPLNASLTTLNASGEASNPFVLAATSDLTTTTKNSSGNDPPTDNAKNAKTTGFPKGPPPMIQDPKICDMILKQIKSQKASGGPPSPDGVSSLGSIDGGAPAPGVSSPSSLGSPASINTTSVDSKKSSGNSKRSSVNPKLNRRRLEQTTANQKSHEFSRRATPSDTSKTTQSKSSSSDSCAELHKLMKAHMKEVCRAEGGRRDQNKKGKGSPKDSGAGNPNSSTTTPAAGGPLSSNPSSALKSDPTGQSPVN